MRAFRNLLPVLILALSLPLAAQEKVTYQDHVFPLVENHCGKCHNPDKKKGDLDLSTHGAALKGGGSGQVLVSGNLDSSKLWRCINHIEEPNMPPNKPRLGDKELDVFKQWILGGLLETSGSKAVAVPSVDLTLTSAPVGKPDGPPPMPEFLSVESVVHTPRPYAVLGMAASPWAPLVALAGQKQVLLYNTDDLQLAGILPYTEGFVTDVKFSRNGKLLLAAGGHGGKSGRVLMWNVLTGERLAVLGEEFDTVLGADISPDQSKLALGGPGKLVKIHSTKTGKLLHKMKRHTDWVTAVAFSPNGELLATADRNGGISVWDPDNGQEVFTLAGHKTAVTALSWRGDSRLLASASEDESIKVWEMQDGKQARAWNGHGGGALSVNYTYDGRIVSCGRDKQVIAWDASGSKVRTFDSFTNIAVRAVFSHDGARVIGSDLDGNVFVWNTKDGKRLGALDSNPFPLATRLANARKRVTELRNRGDKPSPALIEARQEVAKLTTASTKANKVLEQAKAEQKVKEDDVNRLKELAAKTPPPDIQVRLSAGRAERQKAREAATNATDSARLSSTALEAAKEGLAEIKGENPAEALAAAQAAVVRLQNAQVQSDLFRLRDGLASKNRERDGLIALVSEKREAVRGAEQQLSGSKDSAAKAKLKAAIKSATSEAKTAETAAAKLALDIATDQKKVEQLASEIGRVKTAAAAPVRHSKL